MKTTTYRRLVPARRLERGQEYLGACEGGYSRKVADRSGWLIAADPIDVFVSDDDVVEMFRHVAAVEARGERFDAIRLDTISKADRDAIDALIEEVEGRK